MTGNEPTWDLSQLVKSTDAFSIQNNLDSMLANAEKLRGTYREKIEKLDSNGVLELLQTRDAFNLEFEGSTLYCHLKYLADSTDPIARQLNDASRRAFLQANQTLAFIDIELGSLLVARPSLVSDPILLEFRHYLERKVRKASHMLSETEERLIIGKDKNGISAWQMLQSEWISTRTFEFEVDGVKRKMPYGEIIGYYQAPNRDLRRRSYQTVYETLGKDEILFASAIRSICDDHLLMCDLRKYPSPMLPSLIDNDIDQETIDSLIGVVLRNLELHRQYLGIKRKLLGLSKMANYDILAPLLVGSKAKYSWQEARSEISAAYSCLDPQIGSWIEEMYDAHHIDGQIRKGKRAGALSSTWMGGKTAFVSHNFHGGIEDLYTLAHELGHSIHAYLSTRAQQPSNLEIGNCIAETGSIFGELLLTERLLSKVKANEEKQMVLLAVLDEFCRAVFHVSARIIFEGSLYGTIKKGEVLDSETVAKLWVEARDRIYGNSVEWLEVMKWDWTTQLHYYKASDRFYNYPYVFAQLLVFALYQIYKEQGADFVSKLKRLLAAGSSRSPRELYKEIGLNISGEASWEKGMKQARELVDMLEQTL